MANENPVDPREFFLPEPNPRPSLWLALIVLAALAAWMAYRRTERLQEIQKSGAAIAAPSPTSEPTPVAMTSERQPGALEFYSSDAGALYMKGVDAASKNDQENAVRFFTQAIEKAPLRAEPYYDRALSYEIMERRAQAITDYDRAIAIAPENSSYRFSRGMLLANLGRNDAARLDADALDKLDPSAAAALQGYLQGR